MNTRSIDELRIADGGWRIEDAVESAIRHPQSAIPDWRLPPGVDRGTWDYAHNSDLARGYDDALRGTPLLDIDLAFASEHFATPGRLIDLGCGTGRLLIPFAKRGFWCLGVDLSEAMLDVLGEKAAAERVSVHRLKANVVELDGIIDETFDYASCLFSTFGMIQGRAHRARMLAHVRRLLRPGGMFVLHAHNLWFRKRWLIGSGWQALRGRAEFGDRTMRQHYGGAALTLHHFRRAEILGELRQAGFAVIECRAVGTAGWLGLPWLLGRLRAYGYLIACHRPNSGTPA